MKADFLIIGAGIAGTVGGLQGVGAWIQSPIAGSGEMPAEATRGGERMARLIV